MSLYIFQSPVTWHNTALHPVALPDCFAIKDGRHGDIALPQPQLNPRQALRRRLALQPRRSLRITLDGLGADGHGAHSFDEYIYFSSLVERTKLMIGLMETLE